MNQYEQNQVKSYIDGYANNIISTNQEMINHNYRYNGDRSGKYKFEDFESEYKLTSKCISNLEYATKYFDYGGNDYNISYAKDAFQRANTSNLNINEQLIFFTNQAIVLAANIELIDHLRLMRERLTLSDLEPIGDDSADFKQKENLYKIDSSIRCYDMNESKLYHQIYSIRYNQGQEYAISLRQQILTEDALTQKIQDL